jgi:hypothetical protein
MTIDERLEKLTERHEALAQSVELMIAENDRRFGQVTANIDKLTAAVDRMVGNTVDLTRIVEEHRIKRLER